MFPCEGLACKRREGNAKAVVDVEHILAAYETVLFENKEARCLEPFGKLYDRVRLFVHQLFVSSGWSRYVGREKRGVRVAVHELRSRVRLREHFDGF